MALKIGRTVVGFVSTNCYFVYNEAKKAVVFDPGDDGARLYDRLTEKGFQVVGIVLTHGHFDHILGVDALKEKAGCKVYAPQTEEKLLADPALNCCRDVGLSRTVKADILLSDQQMVDIDGISFRVLLTPGHTAGSACYYFAEDKILIAGDTLFAGSVGRTDLPTGNMGELMTSIRQKLMTLPEDVIVYPGHGDDTTIGEEKQYNPYC